MIELGTARELFVDDYLIEYIKSDAQLRLHQPVLTPRTRHCSGVCYTTIIHEDGRFRRYQRTVRPSYQGERFDGHPGELTEYLESTDGVHWKAPVLSLFNVDGSRKNNIVLAGTSTGSHNFTPFFDKNPNGTAARRYKALGGVHPGGGLYAWASRDGLRWRKIQAPPVMVSQDFAFDSQNVSFWSTVEKQYVCYFRTWKTSHGHLRTISRTTSFDFVNWSTPVPMDPNLSGEHLYTSGTHPYFRAPHIYLALPTRFIEERGSSTDILFMSSRAGTSYYSRPFTEAFIRPGLDQQRWGNRANYAAWGVVPTGVAELSIYVSDRRYTLRTDGFVSLHGGVKGGELLTRPFRFSGSDLQLNYATSAAGSLRAELRDEHNKALPGYRLRDCAPLVGDDIERTLRWQGDLSASALAGQTVRLRFVLEDADLYAFCFAPVVI